MSPGDHTNPAPAMSVVGGALLSQGVSPGRKSPAGPQGEGAASLATCRSPNTPLVTKPRCQGLPSPGQQLRWAGRPQLGLAASAEALTCIYSTYLLTQQAEATRTLGPTCECQSSGLRAQRGGGNIDFQKVQKRPCAWCARVCFYTHRAYRVSKWSLSLSWAKSGPQLVL